MSTVTLYYHSDDSVTAQYYGDMAGDDVVIEGTVSGSKIEHYSDGRISQHMYTLVIPRHSLGPLCAKFNISWSPETFFKELSTRFGGELMCSAISNFLNEAGFEHKYIPSSKR